MPALPRRLLLDRARQIIGLGSAALVLALTIFVASPSAHAWLHDDHGENSSEQGCAVTLFAGGVAPALDHPVVVPPEDASRATRFAAIRELFLISSRYLRQPERGPPGV